MPETASIAIRDRHGFVRSVPALASMVFGRQPQCDVVLPDGMVSRTHLRVQRLGEEWWAEDLGSSHGTFRGDEPITRTRWEPGGSLRIADGAYILTLQAETAATPTEANLQAILQTAALLTGEVELDGLLDRTLDRLLTLSGTDRGCILLPEQEELAVRAQRNLDGPEAGLPGTLQLSRSSVRQVFERGEAVWIRNAPDQDLGGHPSLTGPNLRTILCLPMQVQGERIGVLYLDSRRPVTEPLDRATFEAIVSLCANAIERTRLAEANLRNQVLATVGQVASTIVHDFKNGLFVIAGHAQLMGLAAGDPNTRHHLAQILGTCDRLGQLSLDIMDYSKVREPKREVLELSRFLATQVEPLQVRAQDAEVTLVCQGPACRVSLDPHRFARVVENLLGNALDALAGRTGGRVLLEWSALGDGVEIRVTDNGKGIPRRVQKRIFEPFFSHGKARGTGLGMATVKRITEEHGGTVEVASVEGQGTTVILRLPGVAQGEPGTATGEYPVQRGAGAGR